MTGRWKAGKSKGRISPSFHRPLEIPQEQRDFHIPTVPATGPLAPNLKPQKHRLPDGSRKLIRKEKSVAEPAFPMSRSQDHYVLETIPGFRIILRLENAPVKDSHS
jgi:hypothetical protein